MAARPQWRLRVAAVAALLAPAAMAVVAAVALAGDVAIAVLAVALVVAASAAPLRFSSMPGALRVRLPRGAGLAPAARAVALTTDNLRALLRVAAGR